MPSGVGNPQDLEPRASRTALKEGCWLATLSSSPPGRLPYSIPRFRASPRERCEGSLHGAQEILLSGSPAEI
jgi:hypothetical protein